MKIPFTKMHGIGNDFIVINGISNSLENLPEFAAKWCDRRFGIGADQLLILEKSGIADFKMRIFNADSSEVEMCGNGIRCLAQYIRQEGLADANELAIETLAGIIYPTIVGDLVQVNMGRPSLSPKSIPILLKDNPVLNVPVTIGTRTYDITAVSMGNPHCVIFVDDISMVPLEEIGQQIETDALFPKRTNVEFVQVVSQSHIKVRVWERGAGITLACGTGACAAAAASVFNRKTGRSLTVSLPGGDLSIVLGEMDVVFMTGPAQRVFDGYIYA
ncbi:diaminopimelate epimerase [bacterium]|nr:diaminopimelate epimerase [bacterium]